MVLFESLKEESDIDQLLYTSSKNIDLGQSYRWSKVMGNSIARAIFNHDYPKMTIFQTSVSNFSVIF